MAIFTACRHKLHLAGFSCANHNIITINSSLSLGYVAIAYPIGNVASSSGSLAALLGFTACMPAILVKYCASFSSSNSNRIPIADTFELF